MLNKKQQTLKWIDLSGKIHIENNINIQNDGDWNKSYRKKIND